MKKPKDQIIVIFGASGDLTYRKLIPALYALFDQNMMPEKFQVIGIGRTVLEESAFRNKMAAGILDFSESNHLKEEEIQAFSKHLSYFSMDVYNPNEYVRLKNHMDDWCEKQQTEANYLFYLSLLPSAFGPIAKNLASSGLQASNVTFRRLIVEKPFGYDLESALKLDAELHEAFAEEQIYRIDHYLGKETVQNLLVMRFSNGVFEPLWNRNFVDRIEITSAESIGMEGRGGYYDGSGALRDMLQNHLLQVVGFVAMEPPSSMDANAIRNETLKVLQSLKQLKEEDVATHVIRGQYVPSKVRGEAIVGYRDEPGVNPNSRTETYVAMKFFIDNWRWGGVPFYVRTGKRLPTRVTEVVVHFKPTPHVLFNQDEVCQHSNQLIIRIQPDEGILLKIGMKQPGAGFNVKPVNMDFHYSDLSNKHLPSAYERLLYDAMVGDSTLYARADAVEAAWKFVAPIQKVWESDPSQKIHGYPAGTWGPENADELMKGCPEGWRYPCKNLADDGQYCEL
ncbi:MAG TPA: glucose-6-phosphate dehydrogenase [Bacteroidales bacterium]|nr:glucose-6-phosphate dehydrogenase [Bacteroidales bacterium]